MDQDTAPVADFAALAELEGPMLLIDEAHAVGVCGPHGRGLAAQSPLTFTYTSLRCHRHWRKPFN